MALSRNKWCLVTVLTILSASVGCWISINSRFLYMDLVHAEYVRDKTEVKLHQPTDSPDEKPETIDEELYLPMTSQDIHPDELALAMEDAQRDKLIEEFPLVYTPPILANVTRKGHTFDVDRTLLTKMGLPPKKFFKLDQTNVRDFVFVTANDQSHFEESCAAIASIQTMFPQYQIHYYDIGLTPDQILKVKSWCHVTYHLFDLSIYPEHVSYLGWKCWKALVIQFALNKFGAVFWFDASFRATQPADQWEDVYQLAIQNNGMVLPTKSVKVFSNYAFTDPIMFWFIPSDIERQKQVGMACTCEMLIFNTEYIYRNVLYWLYLCSLESMCCPPTSSVNNKRAMFSAEQRDNSTLFKVHRYDQSATNILLSNLRGYDVTIYTGSNGHHITNRHVEQYNVKQC